MPARLTTTVLEKKRVQAGQATWVADADCRGLRVRIANTNNAGRTVTFYYRYKDRTTGKLKPVSLGQYPGLGLQEARSLVDRELRPAADAGINVRTRLKQLREQGREKAIRALPTLIADFLASVESAGLASGTIKKYRSYLRPLAVWWDDRSPVDITRGDVQDLFDRVKREGVPPFDIDGTTPISRKGKAVGGHRAAGMTLAAGRAFWSWMVDREMVQSNPWKDQKRLAKEGASGVADRALDDTEIKVVLAASEGALSPRDSVALRLMLATGLRPSEVCDAEWREIDLQTATWDIPKGRMKYKLSGHRVYLSAYACSLLMAWRKTQHGRHQYVFPAQGDKIQHLDARYLTNCLKKLGVEGFTSKVCRATASTGLQRLGCPLEVRQKIRHHQRGDRVARSYDHHQYDKETRDWWERWGEHLEELEPVEDAQNESQSDKIQG